ncbi:MAG TPA: acyltransferase [Caulobacteraceae bacterium]|nr:acyltransferase [Caulobacteraceae bacterium]
MSQSPQRRMFYTIDGLRGLAALLVVTRHIIPLHAGQLTTASSYLAVELFFLFSGFVIAHAYDKRFAEGLGFWTFAKVRILRLYPLYLLAFAIAVLTVPAARLAGIKTWALDPAVIIPGLLMLPTFARGAYGLVYPYNNPSWTLFFELTANAAYALIWRWLNNLALMVVLAMSALGLAYTALHFGSLDVGFSSKQFVGGFGRVFFSFFAGVGVYRLQLVRPCTLKISPWLLLAGCFVLLIAWPHRGPERTAYDMACALLIFPLFAYLSTAVEPGPFGQKLFSLGGGASYALYLIHSPLGGVLNQFFILYGRPKGSALLGITFIACMAVIAWLAERYYDRPVRHWLTKLTTAKTPAR